MLKTCLTGSGFLIIILFVLAAEYGIDPTGLGNTTGLNRIYQAKFEYYLEKGLERQALVPISGAMRSPDDKWQVTLAPFESAEFKYELEQGEVIRFHWSAKMPLHVDMHAHPFDGGEALTESYIVAEKVSFSGVYTAGFTGLHGWYWQNRHFEPVTLTLSVQGDMKQSVIYRNGGAVKRPVNGRD